MAKVDEAVTKNASDPMEEARNKRSVENQKAAATGAVKDVSDSDPQREKARAAETPDELADKKKLGETPKAVNAKERQALPATGRSEAEPLKGLADPPNPVGHPIEERQAHDSVAGKPFGDNRLKIKSGGQKVPDRFDVVVDNVIVGRSEDEDERMAIARKERESRRK